MMQWGPLELTQVARLLVEVRNHTVNYYATCLTSRDKEVLVHVFCISVYLSLTKENQILINLNTCEL